MDEFTTEDIQSIDHAGRTLRDRGWSKSFSLDQMMAAWEELVTKIESGYSGMVDEYTNNLACRDWLDAAWPLLTVHARTLQKPGLDALDVRFLAATKEYSAIELSRFYRIEPGDGWWWRRIPIRRAGEFADDLRAL